MSSLNRWLHSPLITWYWRLRRDKEAMKLILETVTTYVSIGTVLLIKSSSELNLNAV